MASITEDTRKPSPYVVRWKEGGSHRSKSFKTEVEAQEFLPVATQAERESRRGSYQSADPSSLEAKVEDSYEAWLKTRSHLSESSIRKAQNAFENWFLPPVGRDIRVRDVTRKDLRDVLDTITQEGYSDHLRAQVFTQVNLWLDWVLGKEHNPCREVRAGSPKRDRSITLLSFADIEALRDATDPPWGLFIEVLALGLRPGEAMALRPEDVSEGELHIERAAKGDGSVGPTKTGRVRVLPIPERLHNDLRWRASGARSMGYDILWRARVRSNWYVSWYNRHWKPARDEVGLDVVPYDLRHTAASRLIKSGFSAVEVARWLGNSPAVVMNTYAHMFPGSLDDMAGVL